jgi:2-polyprenyl-6-methoxyphenol hydroxylase-like FAD-dependent oxidoreductase
LSLILAQAGIDVTLIDKESIVDSSPRASHLAAPGIQIFRRTGVYEDIRQAGFLPEKLSFRKIDGTPIATLDDIAVAKSLDATVVLPIGKLCPILLSHVEKEPKISLKWKTRVLNVGQNEDSAWVDVVSEDGKEEKIIADYVCGCDGGTSRVRKSILGEKSFPGKTWDVQFVATDVSLGYKSSFLTC